MSRDFRGIRSSSGAFVRDWELEQGADRYTIRRARNRIFTVLIIGI